MNGVLSAIRVSENLKVLAWLENKNNEPFSCPECEQFVVLKKGSVKIHHFAHKPPILCSYGKGESEEHRQCKVEMFERLDKEPSVSGCEMEKNLGTIRPDIFFFLRKTPVAIEVQLSTLSLEQIIYRTIEYLQKGIHVLWLPKFKENLLLDRYNPRIWEKWLHTTYFGRVYYWHSNLNMIPVHFGDHYLYIEERSWFEAGGIENSAGGYKKLSKRFKTPLVGKPVNLIRDFRPFTRKPVITTAYTVPESKLLLDNQSNWW